MRANIPHRIKNQIGFAAERNSFIVFEENQIRTKDCEKYCEKNHEVLRLGSHIT